MMAMRRLSHLAGIMMLGVVGIMLTLESSDTIDGAWRADFAEKFERAMFPDVKLWVPGLVGAMLALLGITLIVAQMAPAKKGVSSVHHVYRGDDGQTRIRGRAAISAVQHELAAIDGVTDVSARIGKKRMEVEVRVDDRADLRSIETEARTRIGHGFWISLGLADLELNLLITHDPNPPRVR